MEKKNWEDLVTLKLINAMNEHALLYSQLDGISGAKKNKSDVEGELRGQKQETGRAMLIRWKENGGEVFNEEEDRRRKKMERELTKRKRRRGHERTPEMPDELRQKRCHRDEMERHHHEEAAEGRRKQYRSRSLSPRREHCSHHHRDRCHKSPSPTPSNFTLSAQKRKSANLPGRRKLPR